jgi:hypothetical protein
VHRRTLQQSFISPLKYHEELLGATHHCLSLAHVTTFYLEAHRATERSTRSNISTGLFSSKSPLNMTGATLMFDQATMHNSSGQQYTYPHPSTEGYYCGKLYIILIRVNLYRISEEGYRLKIWKVHRPCRYPSVPLNKTTDPHLSPLPSKVQVLQEFSQREQAPTSPHPSANYPISQLGDCASRSR